MNRNDINSSATADDITKAFFARFSADGLNKVSIGEVCEDCHVSRTTFYRYFPDKFAVLDRKEQFLLEGTEPLSNPELMFFVNENGKRNPSREFLDILGFISENMFYYRAILSSDFSRRFMVKWSAQINEGISGKMQRAELENPDFFVRTISGGLLASISNWIEKESSMTVQEVADILCVIFSGTAEI